MTRWVQPRTCERVTVPMVGRQGYFGKGSRRVYGVIMEVERAYDLGGNVIVEYSVLTDKLVTVWYRWVDPLARDVVIYDRKVDTGKVEEDG